LGTVKARVLTAIFIFIPTSLIALSGSTFWLALKQYASGKVELANLISDPLIALGVGDSTMYILQSYSLAENLHLESQSKIDGHLNSAGLKLTQPEVRDQLYLAHIDRSRILYPLLAALLRIGVGNYSFLLVNLACLFGIIYILLLLMHQFNIINVSLLIFVILSPIFQFVYSALPEMLCYFLLILYLYHYLCLENVNIENKTSNMKFSLCLIALLLTKPLFVITFFTAAAMYLVRKRRIFLHHALLSVLASVLWLISNVTKLAPAQLLNGDMPLQNVIRWNFQGNLPETTNSVSNGSDTVQKTYDSFVNIPYRIVSEVNAQISLDQNVSIIAMILPLVFLLTIKSFESLKIIFAVYLGALITQGYSGSYGINFRYLNYGIVTSIVLSIFHSKNYEITSPKS